MVAFITAELIRTNEDLARTKNVGFTGYLVKPIDVDRLNRVLEQAAPAK